MIPSDAARTISALVVVLLGLVAPPGFELELARTARADPIASRSGPAAESGDADPDPALAQARRVVAIAKPLFEAGHYEAALAEYSRAYQMLAGHPRQYWVLYNLAACNERLFRYDIALTLYDEYLKRAPPSEPDRAEVVAIMRTLRSLLGTLVVRSSVSGEVWVDDRRMGTAPGRWLVPTGRHTVEVRAKLYEAQRREVQLGAGQTQSVSFELRRLSTYTGPGRGYFWTALGLSGAATVAGATFGLMALSSREQGRDRAELFLDTRSDADRTRDLALAADVGFGAGIVFAATATVLYFVTDWSPRDTAEAAHRTARSGLVLRRPGSPGEALRLEF